MQIIVLIIDVNALRIKKAPTYDYQNRSLDPISYEPHCVGCCLLLLE